MGIAGQGIAAKEEKVASPYTRIPQILPFLYLKCPAKGGLIPNL